MEQGRAGGCRGASCWCLSLLSPRSKNLTWRDMQHLVVQTSKPAHLNANDWVTNGVGRKGTGGQGLGAHNSPGAQEASGCSTYPAVPTVSHSYGYGLLDAGAMVSLARNWITVGPQRKCVMDILTEPK